MSEKGNWIKGPLEWFRKSGSPKSRFNFRAFFDDPVALDFTEQAVRVLNPLDEVTRRHRRSLLGVCAIAILVVHSKEIATEITVLGIKMSGLQLESVMWILLFLILYFAIAFVFYLVPSYQAWNMAKLDVKKGLDQAWHYMDRVDEKRKKRISVLEQGDVPEAQIADEERQVADMGRAVEERKREHDRQLKALNRHKSYAFIRLIFFDAIFPLVAAVYALWNLITRLIS